MRVLITGASGFIGRHLIPLLLQENHEILVLGRKSIENINCKIRSIICDLRDLASVSTQIVEFDPQACLHLAWEGIPNFSYEQCKRNLDYSLNLIQMLIGRTSCKKIVVSGSSWEYGKQHGVCKETDPSISSSYFTWAKNSIYACGSLLCTESQRDFVWLRLFFAFGPGQRENALIPTLYNAYKKGGAPNINNPLNAQDFIDVRDVAEAFRVSIQKPISSGVYNIGRGEPVTVSDVCAIVEAQMNQFSARIHSADKGPFSSSVRNWADPSKFQNATGWRPLISVQEGIQNHIEFLERQ